MQRLDDVRGLRIRLLGDRVLQNAAWKVADQLGWSDTFDAEYVELTQLQADALITLDGQLAHAVKDLVSIEPIGDTFLIESTRCESHAAVNALFLPRVAEFCRRLWQVDGAYAARRGKDAS